MDKASKDLAFIRVDKNAFAFCESGSIDSLIMEATEKAVVVPFEGGWADLGSWISVSDHTAKDANNNSLIGNVITHETNNSYIRSDKSIVATVGMQDLIIVVDKNVVLIADKKAPKT